MQLKIITTGGTIDNIEYSTENQAPKINKSHIAEFLKQGRMSIPYKIKNLMNKDSKFITEEDQIKILKTCQSAKEDNIIITHGTISMVTTAKLLQKNNIKKTIILVGSAVLGLKENSDALFNLGAAVMAAQSQSQGVYIVMNGRIFNPDNVKKNFDTGRFETLK